MKALNVDGIPIVLRLLLFPMYSHPNSFLFLREESHTLLDPLQHNGFRMMCSYLRTPVRMYNILYQSESSLHFILLMPINLYLIFTKYMKNLGPTSSANKIDSFYKQKKIY